MDTNDAPNKLRLPVLPNNRKVDELRQQPPQFAERDAAQTSHVNRAASNGRPAHDIALENRIVEALRDIYDPEIPVNLYDLGLIYDIEIAPDNAVRIRMTLTAPGCPVAGTLPVEVERRIENIDVVKSAAVEIVWDPPWSREMMSEIARLELCM
jgi:FeS assembly SUF system protein